MGNVSVVVVAQRIIRPKGAKVATLTGGVHVFASLDSLRAFAKRQRKVYAFITSDESEGTMRSGRKMRKCDSIVKNVVGTLSK